MIAVLSTSLSSESKSHLLAREAERVLREAGETVSFLDLRDNALPLCDGDAAYQHSEVQRVHSLLEGAAGFLVATAIYNYNVNAALKNLIELTGPAWEDKVVGFLCAAGSMSGYMSILPLANSLMLDFRSLIVPRFVYATSAAFRDGAIDPEVLRRVGELALTTRALAACAASTAR